MKRLTFWLGVALLTFITGLVVSLTWFSYQQPIAKMLEDPSVRTERVPAKITEAPTVAFCDLMRSPQSYENQLVRVQAIFSVGTEVSALHDFGCRGGDNIAYPEFESDEAFAESKRHLADVPSFPEYRYPKRAQMIVVGRLQGPSKEGYGHLNSCRFKFSIAHVEKAEEVPESIPWRF